VFAFVFVVLFSMIVPYNMDEFVHYDTILCHLFPGNDLHRACDPFQLNILNTGLILPMRAFWYSGSFPALYFLPIFLIWNSPLAARMLGFIFLMCGGVVAARAFSFKPKYVVPALILTFPYLFQHLVDTGPISVHVLLVFVLYVLLDRWCATQQWLPALAVPFMIFLGIWTKLAFLWFAPGIALFLVIHSVRHWKQIRRPGRFSLFLLQTAVALGVLAALLSLLFLSTAPDDSSFRPYIDELRISTAYTFSEMAHGVWLRSAAFYALLHPLEATHRVFDVLPEPALSTLYSLVHYLFVPVALVLMLFFPRTFKRRALLLPAALYVSFILTVLMILRTKESWAMHHAILSYPFLILAALATIRCMLDANPSVHWPWNHVVLLAFGTLFVELNLCFFALFPTQNYWIDTSPQKLLVQRIINSGSIPGRTMVLVVDWGMYYYSGLFGSSQKSVFNEEGLNDPKRVDFLKNLAKENNRKIVILYRPKNSVINAPLLKWQMKAEPCAATPPESDWAILAEPDDEIRATCARYAAASSGATLAQKLLLRASLTR